MSHANDNTNADCPGAPVIHMSEHARRKSSYCLRKKEYRLKLVACVSACRVVAALGFPMRCVWTRRRAIAIKYFEEFGARIFVGPQEPALSQRHRPGIRGHADAPGICVSESKCGPGVWRCGHSFTA